MQKRNIFPKITPTIEIAGVLYYKNHQPMITLVKISFLLGLALIYIQ